MAGKTTTRARAKAEAAATPVSWPADKIFRRKVDALVPYARNARTHSEAQISQIMASIREWGFTNPVLIDETDGIIAGHGRVLAAKRLGIVDLPCVRAEGWSEAKKRAYVLADNQIALNAGWDNELLKVELGDLNAAGFDMDLLGFDADSLSDLAGIGRTEGLTDPDDAPPVPAKPTTKPGDVYLLGKHRLVCGDCTSADDVAKALAGVVPNLMVTDPPYGVNYDPAWRVRFGQKGVAKGKVTNDDRADWREAWALFPGAVAYVWHGALHGIEVATSLEAAGFKPRAQIVWVKTRAPISRGNYHWQHEPAFYAEKDEGGVEGFRVEHDLVAYNVRAGQRSSWRGGRKQTTVWMIEHLKNDTGHGTQKPVECMRRPIANNSSAGQAVYDPFLGSGTTLIACEMEGRACHGLEIDPAYCDVIVKRWEDFTGLKAKRERGNG